MLRIAELGGDGPDSSYDGQCPVLSQILGFKFQQYQSSEKIESNGRKLYITAALLIHEGLIKLEDVYNHKDMAKHESNMKEKAIAAQSSGLPSMGDVPARGTQAGAPQNLLTATPIAESARSLTFLGYDVLIYTIPTAFSNSSKPRMKDDGTSVALWLQSLSTYWNLWIMVENMWTARSAEDEHLDCPNA
ncbi:hypothetical protein BS47DRAFT_1388951 [Hydnum rufescens UP504]|uniref:Uncharacterized protein n=1 Tax=Hydnum rufescens UP504 TaxID=1448309 RepID=A0A9P6DYJ8_9AGAM|nr:hypothetical protein BS47DRAFT_1388951 [Hydnum rufescens UP504]